MIVKLLPFFSNFLEELNQDYSEVGVSSSGRNQEKGFISLLNFGDSILLESSTCYLYGMGHSKKIHSSSPTTNVYQIDRELI